MPTTSLLILLVVAIWAAYLLQHWIRRREAMATARSVDRFSEAMRVLAKRDPLPQGIAPMVRSRPTSALPPQVSVKTARTSLRAGQPTVGDEMNDAQQAGTQAPKQTPARERFAGIATGGKQALAKVRGLNGRQVRGISLLGALALTAVGLVLAPFGVVSWFVPLVGLLATVGVVAWLRSSVVAQQRARSAAPVHRAPRRTVRTESFAAPADTAAFEALEAEEAAATTESVHAAAPFGFEEQAEAPVAETVVAESDVVFDARDNDADGWRPTQVPRPTYAMKERAPQTEVAPAPTVEDLPFDGLALDEDLEELPAVYRAG